jgi:hypothetical protein
MTAPPSNSRLDMRVVLRDRFLAHINTERIPAELTTAQLVSRCINALETFRVTVAERQAFYRQEFAQGDALIVPACVGALTKAVGQGQNPVVLSYGSGPSGNTERKIDTALRARGVEVTRWVGADATATWTPDSFFAEDCFVATPVDDDRPLHSLVKPDAHSLIVIIGNYVVHHLRQGLRGFLQRAQAAPVLLLEEPLQADEWDDPTRRLQRVAYDVLANEIINPGWSQTFRRDHSAFVINYVDPDDVRSLGGSEMPVAGTLVPTSLLGFNGMNDCLATSN